MPQLNIVMCVRSFVQNHRLFALDGFLHVCLRLEIIVYSVFAHFELLRPGIQKT